MTIISTFRECTSYDGVSILAKVSIVTLRGRGVKKSGNSTLSVGLESWGSGTLQFSCLECYLEVSYRILAKRNWERIY